ncbi:hypothetical protein PV721_17830 [Streptomyces sp. MB09-01]|uniref:hypothetical protein n=1 Tax=Streptomyces sp. MB09-01 TaxID=3028666 RepID=UPI0029A5E7B7|nr:hypothetical protein [Streptomyces sp. MB09-01]MDX3536198.1 hypothetical protein [Streptomyces sp. MB09-01]
MKEYIPFAASTLMYLLSPLLVRKAQKAVMRAIAESDNLLEGEHEKPAHLQDSSIKKYVAFAVDAAQIVPAILLTGVAVTLAIPNDWPPSLAGVLIIVVSLVVVGADAYVLSLDPHQYAKKKWRGYSVVEISGISLNLIGIVLLASLG